MQSGVVRCFLEPTNSANSAKILLTSKTYKVLIRSKNHTFFFHWLQWNRLPTRSGIESHLFKICTRQFLQDAPDVLVDLETFKECRFTETTTKNKTYTVVCVKNPLTFLAAKSTPAQQALRYPSAGCLCAWKTHTWQFYEWTKHLHYTLQTTAGLTEQNIRPKVNKYWSNSVKRGIADRC